MSTTSSKVSCAGLYSSAAMSGTTIQATGTIRATGAMHAAGGYNIKVKHAKIPTAANSVAVTGVSAGDILQGAVGFKLSGALIKTTADFFTACTLGAAKIIIAGGVKACSNGLLLLVFVKRLLSAS